MMARAVLVILLVGLGACATGTTATPPPVTVDNDNLAPGTKRRRSEFAVSDPCRLW
jgi:hypothetical protein